MNCGLEFLREFSENVSASTSAMSFLVVASVWFFVRYLTVVDYSFPEIFLIILQIVLVFGKGAQLVDIVLPTFLLGFLNEFLCFCPEELKSMRLVVVGCLLNLHKAALHRRIALVQSSLNQGVLCLFEVEVFAIDLFAIDINVSVKYFVWSVVLGSWKSSCLQRVSKTSQFALFSFQ